MSFKDPETSFNLPTLDTSSVCRRLATALVVGGLSLGVGAPAEAKPTATADQPAYNPVLAANNLASTHFTSEDSSLTGAYSNFIRMSRMPTPIVDINIINQDCVSDSARGVVAACAFPTGEGTATILLNATKLRQEGGVQKTLYHELGHSFDYTMLNDKDRQEFRRINGDKRDWRSPPNSPHEQFGEAYMGCSFHDQLTSKKVPMMRNDEGELVMSGGYDYNPSKRQFKMACLLIKRIGRREAFRFAPDAVSRLKKSEV